MIVARPTDDQAAFREPILAGSPAQMAKIRVSITGGSRSLEETSRLICKIPYPSVDYPNILAIQENGPVLLGHLSFDLLRL